MENQTSPINIPAEPIVSSENSNRNYWKTIGIGMSIVSFCTAIAFVGYFLVLNKNSNKTAQTACTMEAKLCPDGSSVGRTGPNCEFSPCPTTTVDPTANWKIYINEKYGFSIKHPSDWNFSTVNYLNNTEDYIIFSIYKGKNIQNSSRLELYKNFAGGFCEGSKNTTTSVITFNNGIEGQKMECPSTITVGFSKDGNRFRLIATYSNDNNWDAKLFNQILSTFKFINSSDMSGWDTYVNSNFGFSIKYPIDYFKYSQKTIDQLYLAPSKGQGGNGPKFLTPDDVWLNVDISSAPASIENYLSSNQDIYLNAQVKHTIVDEVNGELVTYDYPAVAGNVKIYNSEALFLYNSSLYKITLSSWNKTSLQKFESNFDQILSTVKFTN